MKKPVCFPYYGRIFCFFLLLITIFTLSGCQNQRKQSQIDLRRDGIEAMAKGQYNNAAKSFKSALGLAGSSVTDMEIDLTYYLAAAYFLQERYDKAIESYSNLIVYNKKNADAYYLRGSVYLDEGEKDRAMADYRAATMIAKDDYELAIAIFKNLRANGMKEDASEYLNAALAINGDKARNYYYRGRIYLILGQEDVAKTAFMKAMEKGSDDAAIFLAKTYMKEKDVKSANEVLGKFLSGKRTVSQSVLAGQVYLSLGEYKKAYKVFDAAQKKMGEEKKKNESYKDLLKGRIAALEFCGEFERAKSDARLYVKEFPADGSMVRELAFLETR